MVESATLVAVTVTLLELVTLGAVNMPPTEMLPPEVDQRTEVFEAFFTTAVNCCGAPEVRVAEAGFIETEMEATGVTVMEL